MINLVKNSFSRIDAEMTEIKELIKLLEDN